jgi:hypothetical protein
MATTNRTFSIEDDALARAEAAASQARISLSAYVTRALRKQTMVDNLRRAAEWEAQMPAEDRAALHAYQTAQAARLAAAGQDVAE